MPGSFMPEIWGMVAGASVTVELVELGHQSRLNGASQRVTHMDARDLKLNSIDGLKDSPRLVLEAHNSCEVPAGCGGVILRWRRRSDIPVGMWLFTTADSGQAFLDAARLVSARPLVGAGRHVLAFRLSGFGGTGRAILLFAGTVEETESVLVDPAIGVSNRFVSADDGTWRYDASDADDDEWMKPDFDDSRWPQMSASQIPPDAGSRAQHMVNRIMQLGGTPIAATSPSSDAVRVRRAFTLGPAPDRGGDVRS
jgi:hypothetical protein